MILVPFDHVNKLVCDGITLDLTALGLPSPLPLPHFLKTFTQILFLLPVLDRDSRHVSDVLS